jgi:dTDP-4-dehydrorhamnose 3,5-epimerase-like enzyme
MNYHSMKIETSSLALDGLKLLHSMRIPDIRGYFAETYVRRDFVAIGMEYEFTQDNESMPRSIGTVRGLHFQIPPFAQTKLVRVARGKILDGVVDLRQSSRRPGAGRRSPHSVQWSGACRSCRAGLRTGFARWSQTA